MSHAADARGSLRARYVAFAQRHAGGLRTLEGLLQVRCRTSAARGARLTGTAHRSLPRGLRPRATRPTSCWKQVTLRARHPTVANCTLTPRAHSASALVGIMGLVNEHVLPRGALEPADAQHTGDAPLGSLLISVLHQLEVLLEMSAERTLGADGKWSVLAAVEALKAALRLTLVARHGGCVLVGDTAPSGCLRPPLPLSDAALAALCVREREERTLRALAAFRQRRTLSACGHAPGRATTLAADACDACSRVAPLRTPFTWTLSPARQQRAFLLTGESLRILRPVVYCLAVRRLGRRSWKPWLAALAMDFGRCVPRCPGGSRRLKQLTTRADAHSTQRQK